MKRLLALFVPLFFLSSIASAECWNELPLQRSEGTYLKYKQEAIRFVKYMTEETIPNSFPLQAVRIVGDKVLIGYQYGGDNKWLFNVYSVDGDFEFGYSFSIRGGNLINYTLSKEDSSVLFFSGQNSAIYRLPADGNMYEIYNIPLSKMDLAVAIDDSGYTIVEASGGNVVIQDSQGRNITILDYEIPYKLDEMPAWLQIILFGVWFLIILYFLSKLSKNRQKPF